MAHYYIDRPGARPAGVLGLSCRLTIRLPIGSDTQSSICLGVPVLRLGERHVCPTCKAEVDPHGWHFLGCGGWQVHRHNAIRDTVAAAWREAGAVVHIEKTLEEAHVLAGRSPPLPASAGGQSASGAPGVPVQVPARPIDLLVLRRHHASAPSAALAVDVTVAMATRGPITGPAATAAMEEGLPAPAVQAAHDGKAARAPAFAARGLGYAPFAVSSNGSLHPVAEDVLVQLVTEWKAARGEGHVGALRRIRMRLSVAQHRLAGQALVEGARACLRLPGDGGIGAVLGDGEPAVVPSHM